MAQLFVLSGPDVGKSFEVAPGDTIGRSPDCIITVRHGSVSRVHAHLEQEGGTWYVVDEGSRNGVLIDGAREARVALSDMAEFSLGELLLRFRATSPEAASAPAPTPAPPPPAPPTRAPVARPAAEEEEDEIVLEEPDEIELEFDEPPAPAAAQLARTAVSPAPRPTPSPSTPLTPLTPSAPPGDTGFGAAAGPAGSSVSRGPVGAGDRVLQYNKVGGGGGFSGADLSQYPFWIRAGLALVGLALAVGLAWLAFHGTSFVKKQVGGGEAAQDG